MYIFNWLIQIYLILIKQREASDLLIHVVSFANTKLFTEGHYIIYIL